MNIFQEIFRKGFGYVDKKFMFSWFVYNNVRPYKNKDF